MTNVGLVPVRELRLGFVVERAEAEALDHPVTREAKKIKLLLARMRIDLGCVERFFSLPPLFTPKQSTFLQE